MIAANIFNRTDEITALYFALATKVTPYFIPYGKMTWAENKYYFSYTKAFSRHKDSVQQLQNLMLNPDCGFNQSWEMDKPHHTLTSRIPHRQQSMKLYDLLGLENRKGDFIAYLSRTCGLKFGSKITVFPEVLPDESGYYCYYFPISGLGIKIQQGDEKVKTIADSISINNTLQLQRDSESNKIYFDNVCIGECPQYIHYLTGLESCLNQDSSLYIVKVNKFDTNGLDIIVGLKIKFTSDPYLLSDLLPMNTMLSQKSFK